jgi:alkylated DNA repair dioxygenase AlkB
MQQLKIFGPVAGVLADDERGRIVHTPGLVPAATAAAWFDEIRRTVDWRSERRFMYSREADTPRLIAHFPLADERRGRVPASILEAHASVVAHTGVPFNSVGLNLYRDGRDSVAPHNDHVLRQGFPIALLSLGATRRMTIRAQEPPPRVLDVDLAAGSLMLMSYETQLHYTHGIPKTDASVGQRISLAFRVKPRDRGHATRPGY